MSLTAGARLQQRQIWELIVFLLTGLSFLLVGLELRPVLETLTARSSGSLVVESLAVVGSVIVLRMVWMFGVTALPGRPPPVQHQSGDAVDVARDDRRRLGRHARAPSAWPPPWPCRPPSPNGTWCSS